MPDNRCSCVAIDLADLREVQFRQDDVEASRKFVANEVCAPGAKTEDSATIVEQGFS